MNKITATFGIVCLAGLSQATLFSTTVFSTGDSNGASPNLSPSFVVSGNSYTANLNNAFIGSGVRTYLDITWWHTFDASVATANSPAVPAYTSVSQTLSGRVRRVSGTGPASFDASLTETILNSSGGYNGSSNPVITYTGVVDTNFQTFSITVPTNFDLPLVSGVAQKNDLIVSVDPNVEVYIDSIQQNFTPVPEPISMIALGIGGLGLLARRKRK